MPDNRAQPLREQRSPADTCPAMAHKPDPSQLIRWAIYKIAARQTWLGEVEAADEREAVEKAAEEFRIDAHRLIAVRR